MQPLNVATFVMELGFLTKQKFGKYRPPVIMTIWAALRWPYKAGSTVSKYIYNCMRM